jgi:hypothetical protein
MVVEVEGDVVVVVVACVVVVGETASTVVVVTGTVVVDVLDPPVGEHDAIARASTRTK